MTKARDISSLIGSSGQIDNTKITLDVNEIPSLTTDKIPNLDAGKITTGTFADARISNSSVVQHSTPFDDNKIVNDISTLALRQASDQNKSAYNTNSQSVDVFQDATGIDTETNTSRNANEYVNTITTTTDSDFVFSLNSDVNNTNPPSLITASGNGVGTNGNDSGITSVSGTVGTYALGFDGGTDAWFRLADNSNLHLNGDFTIDYFWYPISTSTSDRLLGKVATGALYEYYLRPHGEFYIQGRGGLGGVYNSFTNNQWHYVAIEAHGSNLNLYLDNSRVEQTTLSSASSTERSADVYFSGAWGDGNGTTQFINGRLDGFRLTQKARYNSASTISKPTSKLIDADIITNATGNFTGTTITAPSSVSEMGAIITYQDNAGTNALNTDIVLQLSADGGSNYSTATLTALPDFSTGIKMAKVNDLAVTAGTSLKYKINFANQASGSKEARIRGVALQY